MAQSLEQLYALKDKLSAELREITDQIAHQEKQENNEILSTAITLLEKYVKRNPCAVCYDFAIECPECCVDTDVDIELDYIVEKIKNLIR